LLTDFCTERAGFSSLSAGVGEGSAGKKKMPAAEPLSFTGGQRLRRDSGYGFSLFIFRGLGFRVNISLSFAALYRRKQAVYQHDTGRSQL
jgi:hypothetical protein